MKKVFIITILLVIFGLTTPPSVAQAASLKIYFGGDILDVLTFSIKIGNTGFSLGPIGKIKDGESKKTVFVFTPAALGVCKKGGHIVGIGVNANFFGYRYIQPVLAYCDND